ncbi:MULTISPECIES: hypothetical protein [Flavobacteriaceae]|uniref:hypothetical protein n=1 Tax=Flavobacteriaceae TaxID=49546 RepID=UPI001492033F|nr:MULTISPECIES: hypothetical protein [Allomuricauda]MDC6365708.1 hypothetical protein [Muricauda sp. AC10]
MKRLAVALMLLTTVGVMAQRHEGRQMREVEKMDMTAEQMATLHTKKLTLALDLSQAQQNQIMQISLEDAEARKSKWEEVKVKKEGGEWTKPTPDERFEMENARLDRQIAHQQKMKEVLSDEQYQTWKKMKHRKAMYSKKKMQEKGRRG